MKTNKDSQAMVRLCDFLVEDIISATDEEILRDAAEDYADPNLLLISVQSSIGKAKLAYAKHKLAAAKKAASVSGSTREDLVDRFDDAQVKRIFELIASQKGMSEFSLAARKGTELTVQDMRSLLEDWQQLGCDLDAIIKGDRE